MNEVKVELIRHQIRSPRSAAIAGIVFSLIMTASMILIIPFTTDAPSNINPAWLEERASTARIAFGLVSFAGIAFLWFTGVKRDRLEQEKICSLPPCFWVAASYSSH